MTDDTTARGSSLNDTPPVFSALDLHFSRMMAEMGGRSSQEVAMAAALASWAVGQGSVCLDLSLWASGPAVIGGAGVSPELEQWRSRLLSSGVVGAPGELKPLILDAGHRLYLHRYWSYEQRTAEALLKRASVLRQYPENAMAAALKRLFQQPAHDGDSTHWPAVAAGVAAVKGLCILSGGPGTGKTYTAVRIMALLQALSQRPLRMVMAAPTGKAASRLMASLTAARNNAGDAADLFAALPQEAFTLHRLLGIRPGTTQPRHHRDNPLCADVVVIDEASMIDISLMCRLLEAVPETATLVLIGDRDQLSSVEAGAVFGDICRTDQGRRFSAALRTALSPVLTMPPTGNAGADGLSDCLVFLERTHRFASGSGLQRLFEAINAGDADAVTGALKSGHPEISWLSSMGPDACRRWLLPQLVQRRIALAAEKDPFQALAQLGHWQVLCALNKGPWGVAAINQIAETAVSGDDRGGHGRFERERWYPGMPVLVLQNDYELGLYNGDVGILMSVEDETAGGHRLRAHFSSQDDRITDIDPLRLPTHEPAHALTVHKSQGSEFKHVVLLLPERDTPVLSRELLYTGMTRATTALTIIAPPHVLEKAVRRAVRRPSGLGPALWGNGA
ncbi:MAG: exodeoxyribonuclease V subunit alpha [Pseudomonadota bacterium]